MQNKPTIEYIKSIEDKNLLFMIKKNILGGMTKSVNFKKNIGFLDMFKNIEFIHNNFSKDELLKYNKNDSLIYLDPPYLLSFNDIYKDYKDIEIFF